MPISKTYCPLLFRELTVRSNGDVSPCCRTPPIPNESANNIQKALNSDYMNNLRYQSLNDIPISQCNRCYQEEKHGKKSMRQYSIDNYKFPTDISLRGLHVSLSNLCNIKCRHCGHGSSSKWYSDAVKMKKNIGEHALISSNFDFRSFDFETVDRLLFYGGEPFLHHKELYEILDFRLGNNTLNKLSISLSTNGTTDLPEKLLDLMSKAKSLYFAFSIDGVGKFAEYFRSDTDWNKVENNIELVRHKFKNCTNIKLAAQTTINMYNINMLLDIENYLSKKWPWLYQQKYALSVPEMLNPRNLPAEFKKIVSDRHNKNTYWDNYIVNLLSEPSAESFDNFIKWHKKLDSIRNEKLEDFNPELASWIETYNR